MLRCCRLWTGICPPRGFHCYPKSTMWICSAGCISEEWPYIASGIYTHIYTRMCRIYVYMCLYYIYVHTAYPISFAHRYQKVTKRLFNYHVGRTNTDVSSVTSQSRLRTKYTIWQLSVPWTSCHSLVSLGFLMKIVLYKLQSAKLPYMYNKVQNSHSTWCIT